MNSAALRTRILTAGGATLAAAGLLTATFVGAATADDHTDSVTVNAEVQNAISLSADASTVTLTEVPGETASAASGVTVTSNNESGYNVTVQADAPALSATGDNEDTIPVSSLSVGGSAASDTEAAQIHSQSEKSDAEGDTVPVTYELPIPHVNADTYSVGLTFTATAN